MPTRLEELVVEAAAESPDRTAVADRDSSWSYRELDGWSNRLARWFAESGVGPGDRVALWAPKSGRAVAVLQAALRIGAIYVPIDPATPPLRALKILDDCDVRRVVTTRAMAAGLPPGRRPFLLDEAADGRDDWGVLRAVSAGPLENPERAGDETAFILYTSGSTGTPKGVCMTHKNALAFVGWAVRTVGADASSVFANHAPFNFDLSVLDLYGAFLTRGTVCLVPETIAWSAPKLVEFLRSNRVTVWYSVPSVLMLMMDHGGLLDAPAPPPQVVIFAGEPFPIRYVRALRRGWPAVRLFNFYGPTETNVCTAYEVRDVPDDRTIPVPIGVAAGGDRVWAVKEDGAVAGEGEKGELWVEGPTVMAGYWGKEPQRGPYRTGDVCLLRPDGNYEFVGRGDQMVKVRGHRVELGDIEAALGGHPNVGELAVLPVGEGLDLRLVAFVAPRQAPAPTLIELKTFGARHLPRYMLVDRVETRVTLPRTPNGKIDRQALLRDLSVRSAGE